MAPRDRSQDSPINPGDPSLLQYRPVDQNYINNDPVAKGYAQRGDMAGLNNYLHTRGMRLPDANTEGYQYDVNQRQIIRTSTPWYKDPAMLGTLGMMGVGGAYAAGAFGGGAAAPAATTAGLGPSTPASMAGTAAALSQGTPALIAADVAAPAVTQAVAPAATAGLLRTFLPKLFDFGTNLAGNVIANRGAQQSAQTLADAATRAAELTAQAQREALDLQRQQYEQTRSDQMPWLQYGTSAINTLGNLMGLRPADIATIPPPQGPAAPTTAGPGSVTQRGGPPGTPTGHTAVPRPLGEVPPTTGRRSDLGDSSALTRTYVPPMPTPSAAPSAGQTPQPPPQAVPRTGTPPTGVQGPQAMQGPQGSAMTVSVKWPDGSTTRIPTSQLARYISLGAQPVGVNSGNNGQQMPQPQPQPTMSGMY
jgi:hypothetical protein